MKPLVKIIIVFQLVMLLALTGVSYFLFTKVDALSMQLADMQLQPQAQPTPRLTTIEAQVTANKVVLERMANIVQTSTEEQHAQLSELQTTVHNLRTDLQKAAETSPPVAADRLEKSPTVAFPKTLATILDGSPLLKDVPRTRDTIRAQVRSDGTAIVSIKVSKDRVPKGISAAKYFEQSGQQVDAKRYKTLCKKSKYQGYLTIFYTLNKEGAARNVPHRGWTSLQHDDLWVPLIVTDKDQMTDVVAWVKNPSTA